MFINKAGQNNMLCRRINMKMNSQDLNEAQDLTKILNALDNINPEYVNKISDELFKHQPFFLSVLLGYRLDTSLEELDELMKIYFLIWEYFKQNGNLQAKMVTKASFEEIQSRNIYMFQYVEGESTENEKLKVYSSDLQHLKSKALLTAVLYRYNNRPVLLRMEEKKMGNFARNKKLYRML